MSKLGATSSSPKVVKLHREPRHYTRDEHSLSRKNISENALKVLYRLHRAGYRALLVGGGVRDSLLDKNPKDFDIATDALPEQVRELFRNCRLIGRRFRLAHIRFGQETIEVATFRAAHDSTSTEAESAEGRILSDNVYGTLDDDAWRRDFTVNALYYDIADFSIIDYVNGMEDLRAGVLRLIGDPEIRYREDPVRMLRAVRFASKLGFTIEDRTRDPLPELGYLLGDISPARMFDESLKLFQGGYALKTFQGLREFGLFAYLFPRVDTILDESTKAKHLIEAALKNTDRRVEAELPITPAFLFAALLWPSMKQELEAADSEGMSSHDAYALAGDAVIARQVASIAIPRRFAITTREIWYLHARLLLQQRRSIGRLMEHKRFRAAYDFLLLRAEVGEIDQEVASWWTEIQEQDDAGREAMISALSNDKHGRGRGANGGKPKNNEKGTKRRRRRRHSSSGNI